VLAYTAEETAFGACARCSTEDLLETLTHCPACNYDLGPVSRYLAPAAPNRLPEPSEAFSFIIYECYFPSPSLNCRLQGESPVVVTALLPPARLQDETAEGTLIRAHGFQCDILRDIGLKPAVGDIAVAVNGTEVTHLNSAHLRRFIARKRKASSDQSVVIVFRRHYIGDLEVSKRPFVYVSQIFSYPSYLLY
jgi:hypothetical protein